MSFKFSPERCQRNNKEFNWAAIFESLGPVTKKVQEPNSLHAQAQEESVSTDRVQNLLL